MSLNCSSNAALDKLQASKDAMQGKLDSLTSAGSSALADVKAQADAIKADLQAALPEIPKLPNLKQELNDLQAQLQSATGTQLVELKTAFKNKWGDSIPDLDNMIQGVQNLATIASNPLAALNIDLGGFSLCDSVPNTDAEVDADGNITSTTEKAKEPTTPSDNAATSAAAPKTIVENENTIIPSIGKTPKEIEDAYRKYRSGELKYSLLDVEWEGGVKGEFLQVNPNGLGISKNDVIKKINKLTKNRLIKEALRIQKKRDDGKTLSQMYNDGELKSKYHSVLKQMIAAWYDYHWFEHYNQVNWTAVKYFEGQITGELGDTFYGHPVGEEAEKFLQDAYTTKDAKMLKDNIFVKTNFPRQDETYNKIKSYVSANNTAILDKYNYDNSIEES